MNTLYDLACLVPTVLCLGFVLWRERSTTKLIDALTSKLMAKNYVEYATYRAEERKADKPEPVPKEGVPAPPPLLDPYLGKTF